MPVFEINGKKYDVQDQYIGQFKEKYPDALTAMEHQGKKWMVKASDYDAFVAKHPQQDSWSMQAPYEEPSAEELQALKQEEEDKYVIGFKAGAKQGWKGMKAGVQYLAGETANLVTGTSRDDAMAYDELSRRIENGEPITEENRPWLKRKADKWLSNHPLTPPALREAAAGRVEQDEINLIINQALEDADGDIDNARRIIAKQKVLDKSWGDKMMEDAAAKMNEMKPTKGFGAWAGNLLPQMIPSGAALVATVITKNPKFATMIGKVGVGAMTAATVGQSMKEARDAGASDSEVWTSGIADGVIEYATEKIPLDRYTRKLFSNTKSKMGAELAEAVADGSSPARKELEQLLKEANKRMGGKLLNGKNVKDLAADMLAEGSSEFLAEAMQTITPILYENPENYPTFTEILTNGWEGAKAGIFMGSVLGGASKAAEHKMQRNRRKQQGYVDIAQAKDEKGQSDIVEIVGLNMQNGNYIVLRDGETSEVAPDNIEQSYRFSFDEFERGVFQSQSDDAYDNGYSLETSQELNDAKNMLEVQEEKIRHLYHLAEDEDVDEFLGDDPIEGIMLSRKAGASEEEQQAKLDYINAKATYDGMLQRIRDDIESQVEGNNQRIDHVVNRDTKMVVPAKMKQDDRPVYIVGGNVVLHDDGSVNNSESTQDIIIYDEAKGGYEFTSPSAILEVGQSSSAEELKATQASQIAEQYATTKGDQIDGVLPFAQGDTYNILGEDGVQHTAQIIADNGDGSVQVAMDGATEATTLPKQQIQAMSQAYNKARAVAYTEQKKAAEVAQQETQAEQKAAEGQPAVVESAQKPVIPTLKDGTPDYNAMDADMFTEQYVSQFGEELTEKIARNNIKEADKAIASVQKQIDGITDPNKLPALYAKQQESEAKKAKYTTVIVNLGLSEDASEDNASRVQRMKKEATPRIAQLFPDGLPNVESVVMADIATGNKIRWTNKEVNGTIVSKGLGAELGLADSKAERTRRISMIGKDAPTPEEYAESLRERLDAMGVRYDESELRNQILNVYASVDTPKNAWEWLENMSANMQADQEGLDYEEEQMRRAYERVRAEQPQDVDFEQHEPEIPSQEEYNQIAQEFDQTEETAHVVEGTQGERTDKQGNRVNQDGSLIVDVVNSIEEITDEDFENPKRSIQLPQLPENVNNAIGADGKPVVIKKNIFERNAISHSDLTPDQSRQILKSALYSTKVYGQNQKKRKPYNWVVISVRDEATPNKLVLLEVNEGKENVEIIHWHYIDQRGLEKLKRQAEREDGQLLILPSENSEEVGALADPTLKLPSDSKDTTSEPKNQEVAEKILQAEAETNIEPSEAQKEAGNYKKGHVSIDGLNITIENPKDTERSGVDENGQKWSVKMNNTYGYIRRTEGKDGDHIDLFLSDHIDDWNGNVFVVDQVKPDGSFDEHKVMYGFDTIEEAEQAYMSNYSIGWKGLGAITGTSKEEFKKWLDSSRRKTKPFAEYKNVKKEERTATKFLSEDAYVQSELDKKKPEGMDMQEYEETDEYVDAYNAAIDSYASYIEGLAKSGELQKMYDSATIGEQIAIRKGVEAAGFEFRDLVTPKKVAKTALITDPAVRAEIVTVQEREKLQQEKTQIEADLSFVTRKFEGYNKLIDALNSKKQNLEQFKYFAARNPRDEYWNRRAEDEAKRVLQTENEIAQEKERLRTKGVNIDDIERQVKQSQSAIEAIQKRIEGLDDFQQELTEKYIREDRAKAAEQGNNLSAYIKERKKENQSGFYKIRPKDEDVRFRVADTSFAHAEEVASNAQKIADKFGLTNEIVVAETQEDYIREIKSEGIPEKEIDLDTYAVYMPSGRIIINAEMTDDVAELSDSIMHEFAHNVTHNGDMPYRIQDTVLEVGEERFEAAGRKIFKKNQYPWKVADEIIATFVGNAANPALYEGEDLISGVVSGQYTTDEAIGVLMGSLTNDIRDGYVDVIEAMMPYVKEVSDAIKTNHDEQGTRAGSSKEKRRVRISVQGYAGEQQKGNNRSYDESYIPHKEYQVHQAEEDSRGRRKAVKEAAELFAKQLNTPIRIVEDVNTITDSNAKLQERKRKAKGYFDPKTGEVVVVLPNATSVEDVRETIFHELVGHKGLRELVGKERFNAFLDKVFANASEEVRERIARRAAKIGWDFREATEEYIAEQAEQGFEDRENRNFFEVVRDLFLDMLSKAKIALGYRINDNDLRYMLWRTYQMQRSKGAMAVAEDMVMQQTLGVGNFRARQISEEEQIIAKSKKDGTYLKTPNGEPTNLTPKQWVQVRTKAFKEWFGDWEKAVRIEKLRASTPIDVAFSEQYELTRKSAKEWMQDNIKGEYVNKDTNEHIVVSNVGINEVTSHGSQSTDHLKSLSAIPQMIENSIFIDELPNSKDHNKYDSYRYYVCGLKIDGVDYTAKIVVGVKGDSKYYDHRLTEIEKGSLIDNLNGLSNSVVDNQDSLVSVSKDTKLNEILQINSSKVVDANGEPKVVYNGSKVQHYNYDGRLRTKGQSATNSKVSFFTDNKTVAERYGKFVNEVFLNIRNPYEVDYNGAGWQGWSGAADGMQRASTDSYADLLANGSVASTLERIIENYGRAEADHLASGKVRKEGVAPDGVIAYDVADPMRSTLYIVRNAEAKDISRNSVTPKGVETFTKLGKASLLFDSQIKSATDNVGSFSKDNDDIRFRDGVSTPAPAASRTSAKDIYNHAVRRPNKSGSVKATHNLDFRLREAYQDSMLALKELQNAILKETGKTMRDWEDAYTAQNHMSSKNKAEAEAYKNGFFKPLMEEVAKLATKGTTYEDVTRYLIAKHGLERNRIFSERDAKKAGKVWDGKIARDYSGLTDLTGEAENFTEAAEAIVKDFEKKHDAGELWKRINAATKNTLKKNYDSGLMSKEDYEHVRDMFKYYIPLRGWNVDVASDEFEYLTSNRPLLSPSLKAAKGRLSLADDPLATIGYMADSAIIQGNRNGMKIRFLNFVQNNPTSLATVNRRWVVEQADGTWRYDDPIIPEDATADEVDAIVKAHNEKMRSLGDKATQKTDGLNLDLRASKQEGQEHTIRVRRNGVEYLIFINGDPAAAQAINGLTNPDVSASTLRKGATYVKNFMARVFTSQNPAFIVMNLVRDVIWAGTAVRIKEDAAYAKRYKANVTDLLTSIQLPKLIKKYQDGKLNPNNEVERYFMEFVLNGGETGYTQINTVDDYKRDIGRMLKEAKNGTSIPKEAWRAVFGGVEFLNRSAEDLTRFAVYMTSRQQGRSITRSVTDAKEITVNFNRKGRGGLGADWINFAYIFSNAAIQSITNFARLTKNHPARTMKAVAKFTMAGFLAPVVSMIAYALLGGDDENYWDIPEWVRRNNIILPIPFSKGYLAIPLPHELRPFYAIGELAMSVLCGKEEVEDALMEAVKGFTGLIPVDLTGNGGNPIVNLMPTVLQPIVQLGVNKDYFGTPIYKKYDYNADDPAWTKAYRGTNAYLVDATRWLNEITGGDNYKRGKINLNPAVIEHLFEGYLGGVGKTLNKAAKTISMIWDEDSRMVRNIPVVSSFIQVPNKLTSNSDMNEKYYDAIDEFKETERILRGYNKDARMGLDEYAEKLNELYESPTFQRYRTMKGYKDAIKELSGRLVDVDPTTRNELETLIMELKVEMFDELEKLEDQADE